MTLPLAIFSNIIIIRYGFEKKCKGLFEPLSAERHRLLLNSTGNYFKRIVDINIFRYKR